VAGRKNLSKTNMKKQKQNKGKHELKPEEFCPIRQTLRVLGKRWTILIIKEIYYSRWQRQSFMNLRKLLVNASSKVLSERLKDMAKNGLIHRREKTDAKPARVYYTLTEKGKDARKIIESLRSYGLKWSGGGTFDCSSTDCELCTKKREENTAGERTTRLAKPFQNG
jgi:DNA-binding HxlR family transcriptional regulator